MGGLIFFGTPCIKELESQVEQARIDIQRKDEALQEAQSRAIQADNLKMFAGWLYANASDELRQSFNEAYPGVINPNMNQEEEQGKEITVTFTRVKVLNAYSHDFSQEGVIHQNLIDFLVNGLR